MSARSFQDLGLGLPLIAAPMAGGPSVPTLVIAAAAAGGLGFLAGGYKTPEQLAAEMASVRSATSTYGVNLFAPNPVPVDGRSYQSYRDELAVEAERYDVALPANPIENDDHFRDKVDLLLEHPAPVVSFTSGLAGRSLVAELHRAGSLIFQTVTSADEALHAAETGVDGLIVQATTAGGHFNTLTPNAIPANRTLPDLLTEINHAAGLPKIAAGGLSDPKEIAATVKCCAVAAMVGTAVLLAPEAGTSSAHRAGLIGPVRSSIVTRAFSGRPARALRNRFTDAHHATAPSGFPAIHHLTVPIRRAAAAAGDPEDVNLWAGTGYRSVVERPLADTFSYLSQDL